MIDQVQSSAKRESALRAQKAFGAGRQGYFDYDFIGLLKVMLSAMPEGPGKQPMEASLRNVKSTESTYVIG